MHLQNKSRFTHFTKFADFCDTESIHDVFQLNTKYLQAFSGGVTQSVSAPNKNRKVAGSMSTLGIMRCCDLGKKTTTNIPAIATV